MMFEIRTAKVQGGGSGTAAQGRDVGQGRSSYLKSQAIVARIVLSPGRKDEAFLFCWWSARKPGKASQESEMGKGLEQNLI